MRPSSIKKITQFFFRDAENKKIVSIPGLEYELFQLCPLLNWS